MDRKHGQALDWAGEAIRQGGAAGLLRAAGVLERLADHAEDDPELREQLRRLMRSWTLRYDLRQGEHARLQEAAATLEAVGERVRGGAPDDLHDARVRKVEPGGRQAGVEHNVNWESQLRAVRLGITEGSPRSLLEAAELLERLGPPAARDPELKRRVLIEARSWRRAYWALMRDVKRLVTGGLTSVNNAKARTSGYEHRVRVPPGGGSKRPQPSVRPRVKRMGPIPEDEARGFVETLDDEQTLREWAAGGERERPRGQPVPNVLARIGGLDVPAAAVVKAYRGSEGGSGEGGDGGDGEGGGGDWERRLVRDAVLVRLAQDRKWSIPGSTPSLDPLLPHLRSLGGRRLREHVKRCLAGFEEEGIAVRWRARTWKYAKSQPVQEMVENIENEWKRAAAQAPGE